MGCIRPYCSLLHAACPHGLLAWSASPFAQSPGLRLLLLHPQSWGEGPGAACATSQMPRLVAREACNRPGRVEQHSGGSAS